MFFIVEGVRAARRRELECVEASAMRAPLAGLVTLGASVCCDSKRHFMRSVGQPAGLAAAINLHIRAGDRPRD
jgi:hypothetical protein